MSNKAAQSAHGDAAVKEIWKTLWILTVLTVVELGIGFYIFKAALPDGTFKNILRASIIVLMLMKAYYIVAYFMHLKHEVRNLIMTILVPLLLFVWFIIAFLYDGDSFRNLRNTYDPYFKEESMKKMEKKEHGAHDEHQPDAKKEGVMD